MSLILNGTTGISDVDGTAAAPALTGTDTNTGIFFPAADTIAFAEGGVEAMRIDSSGNVVIGSTTAEGKFEVRGHAGAQSFLIGYGANGDNYYTCGSSGIQVFRSANTERARIDSSGNLLVGTTSFSGGSTIGLQINATSSSSGAYAQLIKNSSGTEIFQMRCNGGLANFSANDANLSDERTKTDIQDAGGYLAKICAIPVRTFKYKDQTDDLLNLGCIAQEVEAIAPELVDPSGFGETPEDGVPLKAIYQTDLQYALMKCIQEQQALITALTTRITALEAA